MAKHKPVVTQTFSVSMTIITDPSNATKPLTETDIKRILNQAIHPDRMDSRIEHISMAVTDMTESIAFREQQKRDAERATQEHHTAADQFEVRVNKYTHSSGVMRVDSIWNDLNEAKLAADYAMCGGRQNFALVYHRGVEVYDAGKTRRSIGSLNTRIRELGWTANGSMSEGVGLAKAGHEDMRITDGGNVGEWQLVLSTIVRGWHAERCHT